MRLHKEHFNAGSPYSCWLKEELTGEIGNYLSGLKNRGLVEKYKIRTDRETRDAIMSIKKLDDLPKNLKQAAVEIIKMELDKDFKC